MNRDRNMKERSFVHWNKNAHRMVDDDRHDVDWNCCIDVEDREDLVMDDDDW